MDGEEDDEQPNLESRIEKPTDGLKELNVEILKRLDRIEKRQKQAPFLTMALFFGSIIISFSFYTANKKDPFIIVSGWIVMGVLFVLVYWALTKWQKE